MKKRIGLAVIIVGVLCLACYILININELKNSTKTADNFDPAESNSEAAFTQANSPEIRECRNVLNQCKQIKDEATTQKVIYGNCVETNYEWQLFKKDMDTAADLGEQVELYIRDNKTRIISCFAFCPDMWRETVYYFRDNETTACFERTEAIASGYLVEIRTRVFMNPLGEIVDRQMTKFDLVTDEEI